MDRQGQGKARAFLKRSLKSECPLVAASDAGSPQVSLMLCGECRAACWAATNLRDRQQAICQKGSHQIMLGAA